MLPITPMLLTNHNRPKHSIKKLKGIVIHWTANTKAGANAVANRTYFNKTSNSVSAHYIVDDRNIIQCIPDDEVAYHVGSKKYTITGNALMEGKYSPNYYTIGIEMCVNSDGDWGKTLKNTKELAAYLMTKYKLSTYNLYRHYDITGKRCPEMMVEEGAWNDFKLSVYNEGSRIKIIVDGKKLDAYGTIIDGSTYAPVRAIAEALGKHVAWEQETRTVIIKG